MKHIVKRRGHTEVYDERKLYASVYSACVALRTPVPKAELVAERVALDVNQWLEPKQEVTSADIFREAGRHLVVYDPDAAYLYTHFRSIS
jgi:transcriptional regulator NrdR family protein